MHESSGRGVLAAFIGVPIFIFVLLYAILHPPLLIVLGIIYAVALVLLCVYEFRKDVRDKKEKAGK